MVEKSEQVSSLQPYSYPLKVEPLKEQKMALHMYLRMGLWKDMLKVPR